MSERVWVYRLAVLYLSGLVDGRGGTLSETQLKYMGLIPPKGLLFFAF